MFWGDFVALYSAPFPAKQRVEVSRPFPYAGLTGYDDVPSLGARTCGSGNF